MSDLKIVTVLSLGAGVQSSTLALMCAKGEVTPMPKAAIFADTQDESKKTYAWLDWLEKQLPYPIIRASKGKLSVESTKVKLSKFGNFYSSYSIPAFITDGIKTGLLMRQCTSSFKIEVIQREIRKLLKKGEVCHQLIGISVDEAHRMKDSRKKYIKNIYPLVDIKISRAGCVVWMKKNGYLKPPRSACVYCPFHNDKEWLALEPEDFKAAVEFEKKYQEAMAKIPTIRGVPFLHRSCVPLDKVVFKTNENQLNLFGNECEGMCGV